MTRHLRRKDCVSAEDLSLARQPWEFWVKNAKQPFFLFLRLGRAYFANL